MVDRRAKPISSAIWSATLLLGTSTPMMTETIQTMAELDEAGDDGTPAPGRPEPA